MNKSEKSKFVYYEYSLDQQRNPTRVIQEIEALGWKFQETFTPKQLQNTVGYLFSKSKQQS